MADEKKLDKNGFPYKEYPGGIRLQQELNRLDKYLASESEQDSGVVGSQELPYNISNAIAISSKALDVAFNKMFLATDNETLQKHSVVAMKATQFLGSMVTVTDDYLKYANKEEKKLLHEDVLACGCLAPEQELPY